VAGERLFCYGIPSIVFIFILFYIIEVWHFFVVVPLEPQSFV
jgi:hypothetical protein